MGCKDAIRFSAKKAMIIGTAGLTAGLSVKALQKKFDIRNQSILISGGTGGRLYCYKITKSSRCKYYSCNWKKNKFQFLKRLGAKTF